MALVAMDGETSTGTADENGTERVTINSGAEIIQIINEDAADAISVRFGDVTVTATSSDCRIPKESFVGLKVPETGTRPTHLAILGTANDPAYTVNQFTNN